MKKHKNKNAFWVAVYKWIGNPLVGTQYQSGLAIGWGGAVMGFHESIGVIGQLS